MISHILITLLDSQTIIFCHSLTNIHTLKHIHTHAYTYTLPLTLTFILSSTNWVTKLIENQAPSLLRKLPPRSAAWWLRRRLTYTAETHTEVCDWIPLFTLNFILSSYFFLALSLLSSLHFSSYVFSLLISSLLLSSTSLLIISYPPPPSSFPLLSYYVISYHITSYHMVDWSITSYFSSAWRDFFQLKLNCLRNFIKISKWKIKVIDFLKVISLFCLSYFFFVSYICTCSLHTEFPMSL